MKLTKTPERKCESCQQPIAIPASAIHKRFCNTQCRNQWHKQQRGQGLRLLKQQAEAAAAAATVTAGKEQN